MRTQYAVLNPMMGQYKDAVTIENAKAIMVEIMMEFIPDEHAILLMQTTGKDKVNTMYDHFLIHTHNSPIALIRLDQDESRTWLDFNISTVKQDILKLLTLKVK